MNPLCFPPLTIETAKPGRLRTVGSVTEAAAFLMTEWPENGQNAAHARAVLICQEAMRGDRAATAARSALVQAAFVTGIYMENT